jgi:hypothetical protein
MSSRRLKLSTYEAVTLREGEEEEEEEEEEDTHNFTLRTQTHAT